MRYLVRAGTAFMWYLNWDKTVFMRYLGQDGTVCRYIICQPKNNLYYKVEKGLEPTKNITLLINSPLEFYLFLKIYS